MTYTTFQILNKSDNCTLIFNKILSIPAKDFTIGYGFDTLATMPNVSRKTIIEVFSFLFLNDFVKGSEAEHCNNEFEKALNKLK